MNEDEKEKAVAERLKELRSFAVAYSGGLNGTLLLKIARRDPGLEFCAVTAASPVFPESERERAREFCRMHRIRHYVVPFDFFGNPSLVKNGLDRCYRCRRALLALVKKEAAARGYTFTVEGSDFSDALAVGPEMDAVEEAGVVSPLRECGLRKKDVRRLAASCGVEFHDEPARPCCLAARIPPGETITLERIRAVSRGEEILRTLGLPAAELHHHGSTARVRIPSEDFPRFADPSFRGKVRGEIMNLGFAAVSLDLAEREGK